MISFRYHVVTLVAIFMALGLGVLFGASFIDQKTVAGLQRSQNRLGTRNKELRDTVVKLEERNSALEKLSAASAEALIRGALKERPVFAVGFQPEAGDAVRAVQEAIVNSGARLEGSLTLSADLDLKTEARRKRLQSVLGTPGADPKSLGDQFVLQFSEALASKRSGFIQRLVEAGFASNGHPAGATPRAEDERVSEGTAVVIVAPAGGREAGRLVLPLARALASASIVTVVAEQGNDVSPVLGQLRSESSLRASTVDSAETPGGQTALILAIRAGYAGTFGHFGSGKGATALLPP